MERDNNSKTDPCGISNALDPLVSLLAVNSSRRRMLSIISLLFIASGASLAQVELPTKSSQSFLDPPRQIGALPNPDAGGLPVESEREKAAEQIKDQEKQRILGILPQFNVSNISNAVGLSPQLKFELAFKTATDPITFLLSGINSAISQAQNSFPEYRQGAEGYGKRFGASYLDTFDATMIGNAMLPIVLHQDPRYFRKGTGSLSTRLGYAVFSTFRSKSDNGDWQPNYSNILGNFAAGAISNLYYPSGERGFVSTYQRAIIVSSEGAIGAIFSEFWPDISHHLFRTH
jgi:hypothetical protein